MMKYNRQYLQLLSAAKDKLTGMEPTALAHRTGFLWNGSTFETKTLGTPIQICWPDCEITPPLTMWHHLTILQYMAGADGTLPTGRDLSLSDFRDGGLVRGGSFDRKNERVLRAIGKHTPEQIQAAARTLGGVVIPGKADLSVRFLFLPRLPLTLHLWLEDEDFPAAGKVLLDAAAERVLPVEAAGTAAGILLENLLEAAEALSEVPARGALGMPPPTNSIGSSCTKESFLSHMD